MVKDRETSADRSSAQVKTLGKGLAVLDLIIRRRTVRTIEVAEYFSIDKGTASRILYTLVQSGFASRVEGRRYSTGPKLQMLQSGRSPASDIRVRARPLLDRLAGKTGESAHLGVLVDNQVLYLDRADSLTPLRVDRPIGSLAPLHCTALGKVFLAFANAQMPESLPVFTARTNTDPDILRAHLRKIAIDGIAVDDEEFCIGVRCVAAPLREVDGSVVAALGLSGPTARVDLERMNQLSELVRETAKLFRSD